jgi:hypothetical protein
MHRRNHRCGKLLAACLLVFSLSAAADTAVSYRVPNGAVLLEHAANGRLRVSADERNWILFTEGRLYSVTVDDDGNSDVIDVTGIGEALRPEIASMPPGVEDFPGDRQVLALDGRTTVAGFVGRDYRLRFVEQGGGVQEFPVVASSDPALAPLAAAIDALAAAFQAQAAQLAPQYADAVAEGLLDFAALQGVMGTVLAYGEGRERIALESYSTRPIAAERFALPSPPRDASREVANLRRMLKLMDWLAP